MDKREMMMQELKSQLGNVVTQGKEYFEDSISDKIKTKFIKYFDENINTNKIIACADTTLFGSFKNGIIFTLDGIYLLEFLEKPKYFNYIYMDSITLIADKKGRTGNEAKLIINSDNGESLEFGYGNYNKEKLKVLLESLINIALQFSDASDIKANGVVSKIDLTEEQKKKCNAIIHTASVAAGGVGAGLAQIPCSDNVIITPIQITMIISLGSVFRLSITEGIAQGIIRSAMASIVGRGIAQITVGWIPGVGNAINTATAAGVTEAIGWSAVSQFYKMEREQRTKYKVDNMKQGYEMASEEFAIKFRKQAEEFINQTKDFRKNLDEYEALLNDYEKYIEELESKLYKTEREVELLKKLKMDYSELRALQECL